MASATLPPDLAGSRLDAALHRLAEPMSRAVARRLCELGAVAVDGVQTGPQERLRAGAAVQWPDAAAAEATLGLGLCVVLVDDDVLVLHKPSGLAVHGGPLVDDSVAARMAAALAPGAGLAHRLDRGASGLLLVGRHAQALRTLAAAMEQGQVEREYLAAVAGAPDRESLTIDLPLRSTDQPRGDLPKVVVDPVAGQPARSRVQVLDRHADRALVAVQLDTGRTHQIRVHLAAVGHPLLGDPRYGDAAANRRSRATHGVHRVMLHGTRLAFPQPRTGERIEVLASHPADLARIFRSLRQPPGPTGPGPGAGRQPPRDPE